MINSRNGPALLNEAFGALLAFNLGIMLKYAERPKVCGDKVVYNVPFYDDLDTTEKAITLHRIVSGLFDPDAPVLNETAYHASALAALENCVKDNIELEIDMQGWSLNKYGKEGRIERAMTISAFQTLCPYDRCPCVDSSDMTTFMKMIDRLFAEIRPRPYFLIAEVPKAKRKILMQRLAVPRRLFRSTGRKKQDFGKRKAGIVPRPARRCNDKVSRRDQWLLTNEPKRGGCEDR